MPHIPPPASLPPGAACDAYLRDSGGPRQDASTTQQQAEIEAYCAQYGLVLRSIYQDVARSGGSVVGRDQFNALIDATRDPLTRPAAILLWNYARFARDLDDAIYYKALLRNRGVIVHSLTDPVPEGQYGRIVEFFIDISNEEKRRQTSSDAKRGLRQLVREYGCVPGTPPVGFNRQPVPLPPRRDGSPRTGHRWVPDPALIPRIRQAYQMRADGGTLAAIHNATRLYSGVNAYKAFFTNPLYIGILQFGDITLENYCDPIIDAATWQAVQQRISQHNQAKRDRSHPRRAASPYLLSGLVYCAQCGAPMSANTVTGGAGRNEAYRCSRAKRRAGCTAARIGRQKLETAILHTLREYILAPDALAALMDVEASASQHRHTRRTARLADLTEERRRTNQQIANLTRAIAERGHSAALLDRLDTLERQRTQLTRQIDELSAPQDQLAAPLTQDQARVLSGEILAILDAAPLEDRRTVLRGLIHEIRVTRNPDGTLNGTISYYSPNNSPPFDTPLPPPGAGYNLPISSPPLGALLYRQIYTHPIKHPRSK